MNRASSKFVAIRQNDQVSFPTRADASRFALNEGNHSRLWSIIEVRASFNGSAADLYAIAEAEIAQLKGGAIHL